MKRISITALTASIMIIIASTATAQQANVPGATTPVAGPPAEQGGLQEVVVTAQRRREDSQNVPISVAAVSGDELVNAGATDVKTLSEMVPSIQVTQVNKNITPFIRGVGSQYVAPGGESAVGLYIDDVYYASQSAAILDLNNIQQVEVLEGPQGTLFGRNSVGGVLNIITRDPSSTPTIDARVGYANFNTVTGSFYGSTGITNDLAVDLAYRSFHQEEGWGRDPYTGQQVNFSRSDDVRSKLLWTPDDWKITLAVDYSHNTTDVGDTRTIVPGTVTLGGYTAPASIYDSIENVSVGQNHGEQYGASLHISRDFGPVSVRSITAFRAGNDYEIFDDDFLPLDVLDVYETNVYHTLQQEFVANGKAGGLNYTAGVFFYRGHQGWDPLTIGNMADHSGFLNINDSQLTTSIAGYGQLDYDFGEGTTVTLGARYSKDKQETSGSSIAGGETTLVNGSDTFDKVTWRAALSQQITTGTLVYGSVSTGYQTGLLPLIPANAPVVNPETILAYELGIKSELIDKVLRLNFAAYHYDLSNVQLNGRVGGLGILYNAASAEITGFEIQTKFAPPQVEQLEMSLGLNFMPEARYGNFPNDIGYESLPPGQGNEEVILNGHGIRMSNSPRVASTATVNYTAQILGGTLKTQATDYYNTGFYPETDQHLFQGAYNLVSASLEFTPGGSRISGRVYGANLLNRAWLSEEESNNFAYVGVPGAPRTYGIEFKYAF